MTFQNGGYWPWLLALGIPVLIHLLTRQAKRVYALPTFAFLKKSLAQQTRVFLLRQRLLLLLRVLLLLALALTFLKPTIPAPLAASGQASRAVVVVLDVSLSMGHRRGGISSLQRARGQAATLLEDLRPGDAANVILAGATPKPVLPEMGGDFGTLRQAVKTAEPTDERADIPAALAAAARELERIAAPRRELILASDFQQKNWQGAKMEELPEKTRIVLLRSDDEARENAGIIHLALNPATPRAGEPAEVVATVWNGSPQARSLPVTLTAQAEDGFDAPTPQRKMVSLPPFAAASVAFPLAFPDAGRYRLTAKLPADELPADDARYLAADLGHSLSVLLLTDADTQNPRSAAYFLSRALNPAPDQPGGIRVIPKRPAALSDTDLKSCDIALMTEAEALPARAAPKLMRFLADGGALLVFLAGQRAPDAMRALQQAAPPGANLPFLPQARLDLRGRGKGYVTLAPIESESPLLQLFQDSGAADLRRIRFARAFITGPPDPAAELLLKFEDGRPAAARSGIGAGSLLICNFSPAPADSDLARQELFPPLVHEFARGMLAPDAAQRAFLPGGPAQATIPAAQARGSVSALYPDGGSRSVTVDRAGGGVMLDRVDAAGFYPILADGQTVALLAVNPHPDESDLRALDPAELEGPRARSAVTVAGGDSLTALEHLRRGRPLWPSCLLAAFAFLLLEHAVAAFGSRPRLR